MSPRKAPPTFAEVAKIESALPEFAVSTSYGTDVLKVKHKLMARILALLAA